MDRIRCYIIADDYRWHVLTDSIDEFKQISNVYFDLMNHSDKENNYYFKNIFLTKQEYVDALRMMAQSTAKRKTPAPKPQPNLRLI